MSAARIIELTEYQSARFAPVEIPVELGKMLFDHYRSQIGVEFPTPKTDNQWELTSQGWVGHIPLTPEFHISLHPKVALHNLFRMLEIAYRLDFKILEGLVDCESLQEFYERLANILARRVLDRGRKGFYRTYLPHTEELPYVRGRLDVRSAVRSPGQVKLACHYQEHTVDVEENQILVWTLLSIIRSGQCSERVLPAIRQAYRLLHGPVTVQQHHAQSCVNRLYNRLNDDYQPLHALCRFFLEQSGPGHQVGNRRMLPFLVNMARLYEQFVAEWLGANSPPNLKLKKQEKVIIGQSGALQFVIDLVLNDAETGATRYVLDTKYKAPDTPAATDIQQMISYAHTKDCREAILIYPTPLKSPFDETIRGIRVRSLTFALDGDLDEAGRALVDSLLQ